MNTALDSSTTPITFVTLQFRREKNSRCLDAPEWAGTTSAEQRMLASLEWTRAYPGKGMRAEVFCQGQLQAEWPLASHHDYHACNKTKSQIPCLVSFPLLCFQWHLFRTWKDFIIFFSEKKANSSLHFSLCQKKQKGILMTIDSLKSWGSLCAIKKMDAVMRGRHYIKTTSPATLLQRCTVSIPKHYRFHKEKVVCVILNTLQQMGVAGKERQDRSVAQCLWPEFE